MVGRSSYDYVTHFIALSGNTRFQVSWERRLCPDWYGMGEDLGMIRKWVGALQNLVFGCFYLRLALSLSKGIYLYDYDFEKERLTFTP